MTTTVSIFLKSWYAPIPYQWEKVYTYETFGINDLTLLNALRYLKTWELHNLIDRLNTTIFGMKRGYKYSIRKHKKGEDKQFHVTKETMALNLFKSGQVKMEFQFSP